MYESNLAGLLDAFEPQARAAADTTAHHCEPIRSHDSPLTAAEIEVLLGAALWARRSRQKRCGLALFHDNFSADFRPFRIR